jgi:hypothetical protein
VGDIGRFIGGVSKVELLVLKLGMNGVRNMFLMDGELVDARSHNPKHNCIERIFSFPPHSLP